MSKRSRRSSATKITTTNNSKNRRQNAKQGTLTRIKRARACIASKRHEHETRPDGLARRFGSTVFSIAVGSIRDDGDAAFCPRDSGSTYAELEKESLIAVA
jgi:hypothetical protein